MEKSNIDNSLKKKGAESLMAVERERERESNILKNWGDIDVTLD